MEKKERRFQEADASIRRNSGKTSEQHHKTKEKNEGREHEGDEDEKVYGVRKPEKKQDPREPSAEERSEHEKTHLPFRSWCRHCVRGRGKEEKGA